MSDNRESRPRIDRIVNSFRVVTLLAWLAKIANWFRPSRGVALRPSDLTQPARLVTGESRTGGGAAAKRSCRDGWRCRFVTWPGDRRTVCQWCGRELMTGPARRRCADGAATYWADALPAQDRAEELARLIAVEPIRTGEWKALVERTRAALVSLREGATAP